jgi:hypothetical protein
MKDLPADAGLMAAAIIAELLIADGLLDRDLLVQQALCLAEAGRAPAALASGLHAFVLVLAERKAARIYPRAPTGLPKR